MNIFGRKFIITGADLAVYRYMKKRPQKFGEEALKSVKEYLQRKGILDSDAQEIERGEAKVPMEGLDSGTLEKY